VRTRSFIRHDEGRLKLGESMRKKYRYGKSMLAYRTTHRGAARRQFRLMRPAFVRHRRALAAEPLTAVGMLAMKTLEFGAGAAGAASTLARRPRQHVAPSSGTDDTSRTLKLLIGDHGRIKSIEFQEGARAFHARVFEDNLWGAVKDNLVLGEYERSGIRLADMRGVVVDAGAHVGLFSLLASAHVETVVALEAHPRNFMLLAENVARNEVSNVQPHQCAVWRTNGAVEFLEGDRTSSGSILGGRGERFVVPSETLDSIVATTGPVDLLKLDIEGAEFDVLEHTTDATLRQISAVVAELHLEGQEQRLAPMLARLRRTGFTVAVRRPPIAYWRETMLALARNRRRLRRERRLRLTVIALYSLVALIRTARRAGSKADERNELMFLYATREPTASEAPTGILDARAHLA
jgi:FkbM family methyltransferase